MALDIKILTVGKPDDWTQPAIQHWSRRIGVFASVRFDYIRTRDRAKLVESIHKRLSEFPIALTRKGKRISSLGWAKLLSDIELRAVSPTFIIGDAEGLPAEIIQSCKRKISLAPITLQHDVALIVLLEQLFRALSILAGTPYHRGE
ncbi:hypothetical protein DRQ33_06530 [bacterium]|nr:MAG: hypothetical protein DRQ33_06530 [bacterium]